MSRPTEGDVRLFLEHNSVEVTEYKSAVRQWMISEYPYAEPDALRLAELCLITGQPLSAVATAELMLNLARRVADLEGGPR